ncbi:MAG: peptidoglycan-binding domain-containing protein, partial [Deltaproteobacteria bacterium]
MKRRIAFLWAVSVAALLAACAASPPKPPPPTEPSPSLAKQLEQLSPEGIRKVQRALARTGDYQGPPDGREGPATRAAVRAFQGRQRLPTTGFLDRRTLTRLGLDPGEVIPARYSQAQTAPAAQAQQKQVSSSAKARAEGAGVLRLERTAATEQAAAAREKPGTARDDLLKKATADEEQAAQKRRSADEVLAKGRLEAAQAAAKGKADERALVAVAKAQHQLALDRAKLRFEQTLVAFHTRGERRVPKEAISTEQGKAVDAENAAADARKAIASD